MIIPPLLAIQAVQGMERFPVQTDVVDGYVMVTLCLIWTVWGRTLLSELVPTSITFRIC